MSKTADLIAAARAAADKLERTAGLDASDAGQEATMREARRWRDLADGAEAEA